MGRPTQTQCTHARTQAAIDPGFAAWCMHKTCSYRPLWRCWLGGRKGIRPVKTEWWGTGVVICLERGANLHMAQLMPLPLTVSCSSKIEIGFTFLVPAHPGSTGKWPLNGCVYDRPVYNGRHQWLHGCMCRPIPTQCTHSRMHTGIDPGFAAWCMHKACSYRPPNAEAVRERGSGPAG